MILNLLRKRSVLLFSSFIAIVGFQNCAPTAGSLSHASLEDDSLASGASLSISTKAEVKVCSKGVMAKLLETAAVGNETIRINCHPTLKSSDIITKRVHFEGSASSGVAFDCQGAVIRPASRKGSEDSVVVMSKRITSSDGSLQWQRPENITIRNCTIEGSIRVIGLGHNGEAQWVKESSQSDDQHTQRAQAAAPTKITFDNITIVGKDRAPLYISPGSTYITLKNSKITGVTLGTAMYLDAESAFNVIQNNRFEVQTPREIIAIDGSAKNLITGNYFTYLTNGGIYVYRNCGEGHTVRHQSPQYNKITNNTFYYKNYTGENPSIWLASRNGNRKYCGEDNGFPWGSSIDNNDLARNNVVSKNKIYKLDPRTMIRMDDNPNEVSGNVTVNEPSTQPTPTPTPKPSPTPIPKPIAVVIDFSCAKSGSNSGCQKTVSCASGKKITSLRAACDLEAPGITNAQMNSTSWGQLQVIRASETVTDGTCSVTVAGKTTAISTGKKSVSISNASSVVVLCKEKDGNGGDCEIRGQIKCE